MGVDIDFSVGGAHPAPYAEHGRIGLPGAIFWSDSLGGWVVSCYGEVRKVISDAANFSNEKTPLSEAFGAEAMLVDDTPRHHKVRNVWARPTSMSGVAAMADNIERIVDNLVVPVAERLNAGETIDLVGVFEDLASELITVLMDIPRQLKHDFLKWNRVISDAAVLPLDENNPIFALRNEYKANVLDFLRTQVQDRRGRLARGEDPQDLISLMVAANSEGITEAVVLDNLLNLLLGALDTSVRWMGNSFMVLDRHPRILSEIRADRSLIPQAIEEVMRLESVVQLNLRINRHENTEIGGQKLKAGDLVYMLTGAANRDPAAFERPSEFDIRRKPKIHLGFGFGIHQCLGMNIARKEVVILLNRLFDLVPGFEIVDSDYGPTWVLWGPLRLMVRTAADTTSRQLAVAPPGLRALLAHGSPAISPQIMCA